MPFSVVSSTIEPFRLLRHLKQLVNHIERLDHVHRHIQRNAGMRTPMHEWTVPACQRNVRGPNRGSLVAFATPAPPPHARFSENRLPVPVTYQKDK
jgi:hypothetical protein